MRRRSTRQAGIERGDDVATVEVRPIVADPVHRRGPCHLGGQNDPVPVPPRSEPCADDFLGPTIGLGTGRDRIHLCRVDEIDAVIQRVIHLRVSVGLVVLLAERHGAEADGAHFQA